MNEHSHWLGRWYGEPLTSEEAAALRDHALQRAENRQHRTRRCHTCALQLLIARYWLEGSAEDEYEQLKLRLKHTAHGRALLELIYGQLLLSRRHINALLHLQRGFDLASSLFASEDYLRVLNQHQQLKVLPLAADGLPPATLHELLTTAAVIARMQQGQPPRLTRPHDPTDLYG